MTTTKTLYLIRHSKADFPSHGVNDLERPLTPQGVIDSHRNASKLTRANVAWDLVISSHAFRAVNTAIIFAGEMSFPLSKILLNEKLYETTVPDYLNVVNSIGDEVKNAAIFGHNDTISAFANYLCDEIVVFENTTVLEIQINADWLFVGRGCALIKKVYHL